MADNLSPQERSRVMSRIRSRNTIPEFAVRSFLHVAGYRFRLHHASLPGHPDIVLTKHRVAIFVHGCFWHRHMGCKLAATPTSNPEFWKTKFRSNQLRDTKQIEALRRGGWRVAIFWECVVRKGVPNASELRALASWIEGSSTFRVFPRRPIQVKGRS